MKNVKILWNIKKWIKIVLLAILYVPVGILAFLCKHFGQFVIPIIELVFGIMEISALYKNFVLNESSYLTLLIPIILGILCYMLMSKILYISFFLKNIIKAEFQCKYGYKVVWNKKETHNKTTYEQNNSSSLSREEYEFKVKKQKEYYESELKKKDADLEKIRKQNENNDLFIGVTDKESLKKRYRDLLKVYHPDNQGGNLLMTVYLKEKYEEELKKYV